MALRLGPEQALFEDVTNRQVIPVSPAIDLGLGGGIREGSFVQMAGDPKSGKTTTAVQFAANCQKEEYGSRPVYYYDVEGRFGTNALDGIEGIGQRKANGVQEGKGLASRGCG
jgi:RecA/RadA recombinase